MNQPQVKKHEILASVKRVVTYNVKVRIKSDGNGVDSRLFLFNDAEGLSAYALLGPWGLRDVAAKLPRLPDWTSTRSTIEALVRATMTPEPLPTPGAVSSRARMPRR